MYPLQLHAPGHLGQMGVAWTEQFPSCPTQSFPILEALRPKKPIKAPGAPDKAGQVDLTGTGLQLTASFPTAHGFKGTSCDSTGCYPGVQDPLEGV